MNGLGDDIIAVTQINQVIVVRSADMPSFNAFNRTGRHSRNRHSRHRLPRIQHEEARTMSQIELDQVCAVAAVNLKMSYRFERQRVIAAAHRQIAR